MELNFSKKTRKIVASLLAVAILLGVLPVSGLTGSSLGGEENNSSASKIFVKSDYQPVLFNSDGSVESVMTKLDGAENVYTATPKDGDKIGVFDDANLTAGNSVVFFNKKGTDWTSPYIYLWNGGNNNGKFPGAVMTQLSDDVYYSVYPSKIYNKVIFSNGNNKQQTNDLDLKDFAVYDSNGILSDESTVSYFKCVDYKEANNVYEFTDSDGWKEANVSKPAPDVTISGNGKEVNVIKGGIGQNVDYTYYSNQTVVAKASNVSGFTSGEVKYSNNVYSVTYTSDEYNFISYEFKSGTVNLKMLPALTVNGEWHVYDNGKEISDDTVVKVTGDEKITAKYEVTSAEYQGNKVSEDDLKITLQLNDKDYSSGSEIMSADLKSENKLSGTVKYKDSKEVALEQHDFKCVNSKGITLKADSAGTKIIKKDDGYHIYSSASPDEAVKVEIESVDEASSYSVTSEKLTVTQSKENERIFTISGVRKLGKDTADLKASYSMYGKTISQSYTVHYKNEINFKVMKYTDKDGATYEYVKKGTTVRAQFCFDVSEQQLIDRIECTYAPENVTKTDFNKTKSDGGKWYEYITEPGTYVFVIYDKCGNTKKVTIKPEDLKIDDKAPTVEKISFKAVETNGDKVLKFLTFGIYSKNEIEVTVNVKDEGLYSSGIKEIKLFDGEKTLNPVSTDYGNNKATFKLSNKEDIYNLKVMAIDNVEYDSGKVDVLSISVFEEIDEDGQIQYVKHEIRKNSEGKFEIVSTDKPSNVTDLSFEPNKQECEYIVEETDYYYSCDGEFSFKVNDTLSGIKSVKAFLDNNEIELIRTDVNPNEKVAFDESYFDVKAENSKSTVKSASFKYTETNLDNGQHTFYVVVQNNSGIETRSADKTIFIDKTAPEVKSFKFETVESDVDRVLSFLTFGIYNNNEIKVTVTADDPDKDGAGNKIASSGVKSITLYNGKNPFETKTVKEDKAEFILSNSESAYHLSATATDNVGNESKYWTFDGVDRISYGNGREFNNLSSYDEPPTWDNFEVVATKKNPEVIIKDEDITAIEGTHKYTDNDKMYFSSGANIKFTVEDKISGINNVKVYLDGDSESGKQLTVTTKYKNGPASYDQLKEKITSDTFSCSTGDLAEGKYTIRIYAQNNSGNSLEDSSKTFYVDKTAPKVTSFKFEDGSNAGDKLLSFLTFGIYHNDKIKVTVTAKDSVVNGISSGVKSITLYNGKNPFKTETVKEDKTEFILSNSESAYHLSATATDNVGNESKYWTFDGVDSISYENGREFNNLSSYDEPPTWDNFEVVSTDKLANIEDISAKPSNSVYKSVSGKDFYSGAVTFKTTVTDELSGIKSVSVNNNITNGVNFTNECKVTAYGVDNNKIDDFDLNSTPYSNEKVVKLEIEFTAQTSELTEGKNEIKISTVNNSGKTSEKTKTIYLDTNTPKVTNFIFSPTVTNNSNNETVENKNAYGYYVNQKTRVTVIAKDSFTAGLDVSGVDTIYYRAVGFDGKTILSGNKKVDGNNSIWFDVEPNFKGYIYAYAVDNVYNGSEDAKYNGKVARKDESHPDGLIVENGAMHAQSSGITATLPNSSYSANGNPLYNGNITIPVTVTDSYSGIKQIEYSVKSNYDTQNNQAQTVDIANSGNGSSIGGWTVNKKDKNLVTQMSRNITVSNNSNDIVLTVKLTDRAGNKTEIEKKFSIDKTKPVIDVKYDNNEHTTYGGNDYYKADRTATVTVTERNFDESLVEAAIMKNGGRYTTIGGWTHNNNTADPDKSTHIAKIVYNTDGDFTFDIAVKDKAMNSADKFTQQKFTVDKTAPVIEVSFDNNSAKNGNYYKADRTATIKITEHNFNSGSQYVNIPVSAEGAAAPSVVGWSGSGDDHNATVSFNKDGKYSFTVDYTDLAGNKAVQKKVESFYIDKTAPEVEITGVADHQAYNGTVAPVVTYKDDNFTDDHDFKFTRIDINSKSDDTAKFDYDTDGNGVTEFIYKYKDFAEVPENDGIYNFTVELSDKAGNSTSKSVTFSVNRFGSTFMAPDESMEKLFDNGYTNAEQDIVVEEINVSPLTKHSVTLSKSGGNSSELVENKDYKFSANGNGNEWSKNTYTVNKSNFSDEAAYTVTIISVDKAKNTNNNRMADSSLSSAEKTKRECTISFVVDKTKPLVSITGIKNGERYKEASKKVKIVCEDDNLDNSNLEVTLDGKKLAEGKDYTIVDGKESTLSGSLTAEIVLKAETGGVEENLKVTIGDLAGNKGEKSVENFILSANIFQRFFANPVLVICTFAGLALVIAIIIFFIAKKRKKAE